MIRTKITAVVITALLSLFAASGQIIFQDTFNDSNAPVWGDINMDLSARQAGGALSSTYTGAASPPPLLQAPVILNGQLLMRIQNTTSGNTNGTLFVDLANDFGPSLVGQEWTLSYSQLITGTGIGAGWCGFSVGVNNPPNTPFANGFGFILGDTGGWAAWNGGTIVGQGTVNAAGGVAHKWYDLTATFDDVAGTVSVDYEDVVNGTINLGIFTTSFAGQSTRYVGLRNHRDALGYDPGPDGTWADMYVDNLQIEVIPEPATLGLFALVGGGLLWFRKRYAI